MVTILEETRKGPWTEQEDLQLVCTVQLYGERRWDFIAKVSGLNRTGKSCRLRWVNYLHPGLKRGRMSPYEEKLIIELHTRWGNRWSRIARQLPGRTDNEIKNYWRTHMRKKEQERRRNLSPSSSTSSLTYQSCLGNPPPTVHVEGKGITNSNSNSCITSILKEGYSGEVVYSMDQIWGEIDEPKEAEGPFEEGKEIVSYATTCTLMPSPAWNYWYYPDSLWRADDDDDHLKALQYACDKK